MSTADCTAAIAGFASGDPTRFRRLPNTCTLADVAASLHSLDTQTRGTLANRSEPMDVRWFSSPNIPQIHAWLDASGHVVLLDAAMPPGTTDAYLKAFGQPEQKLDYRWRSDALPGAELLWLTRGAVVIGAPNGNGLLRAGIFAPASLEDYKANLRYIDIEEVDEG